MSGQNNLDPADPFALTPEEAARLRQSLPARTNEAFDAVLALTEYEQAALMGWLCNEAPRLVLRGVSEVPGLVEEARARAARRKLFWGGAGPVQWDV